MHYSGGHTSTWGFMSWLIFKAPGFRRGPWSFWGDCSSRHNPIKISVARSKDPCYPQSEKPTPTAREHHR
jgi:hypothetical protein